MAIFSNLLGRVRSTFDPDSLAMTRALLAGDYDAAAQMAERFRRLQAEHDRLQMRGRRKEVDAKFGDSPFAGNADAAFDDGLPSDHESTQAIGVDLAFNRSEPFDPAGPAHEVAADVNPASMQEGFDRQQEHSIAERRARETGRNPMDILREMRGLPALPRPEAPRDAAKPRPSPRNPAAENHIFEEKLRRGGGLNGYGYVPTERDVNLLARALFSEFGNVASWQDMRSGGWSMINRIRPAARRDRNELGRTLAEVLETTNPNGVQQYSFMPRGGVDAPGGSDQWRLSARPEALTGPNRKSWELANQTARDLLGGTLNDPTGGATFFRHRSIPEDDFWRSLIPSPYRSPTAENFFHHVPSEPPRLMSPQKPTIRGRSPR